MVNNKEEKPTEAIDEENSNIPIVQNKRQSHFLGFFVKAYKCTLGLIFPQKIKCVVCNKDLKKNSKYEVCDECLQKLEFIPANHCCIRCGAKLKAEEKFCYNCQRDERFFDQARSSFVYDGDIKNLVHKLKFENKQYIARAFATFLAETLKETDWEFDKIIPVPISEGKLKSRGYNQAKLLADELANILKREVNSEALQKVKETSDQVGLSYLERKKNLKGSFKVADRYAVRNNNILLIDDVMTTGATASACAEVLKKAKANRVFVLTVAHGVVELPELQPIKQEKTK